MRDIEKKVIRTLCYQSIFNYAPTLEELHLFFHSSSIHSYQELQGSLSGHPGIHGKNGRLCLSGEETLITSTSQKVRWSKEKLKKAEKIAKILGFLPWFKMVGLSGAVASNNATEDDDIDLFVIVAKDRIWLARLCDFAILNLLRIRRNAKSSEFKDKICINFYLAEDNLELENKDIYVANEVARLIPLYGESCYAEFVNSNNWIKKYLANFWNDFEERYSLPAACPPMRRDEAGNSYSISDSNRRRRGDSNSFSYNVSSCKITIPGFGMLNNLLGRLQKKYMSAKMTNEKVDGKEIRFHPKDSRMRTLKKYEELCEKYGIKE